MELPLPFATPEHQHLFQKPSTTSLLDNEHALCTDTDTERCVVRSLKDEGRKIDDESNEEKSEKTKKISGEFISWVSGLRF